MHVVRVNILSGDHPKQVGGRRIGALARAPFLTPGASNVVMPPQGAPHEAVIHAARVDVFSSNHPRRLMPSGTVPWPEPVPAPGTSNVVMSPFGTAHEAVIHAVRINVVSRDRPQVADA